MFGKGFASYLHANIALAKDGPAEWELAAGVNPKVLIWVDARIRVHVLQLSQSNNVPTQGHRRHSDAAMERHKCWRLMVQLQFVSNEQKQLRAGVSPITLQYAGAQLLYISLITSIVTGGSKTGACVVPSNRSFEQSLANMVYIAKGLRFSASFTMPCWRVFCLSVKIFWSNNDVYVFLYNNSLRKDCTLARYLVYRADALCWSCDCHE